MWESKEFNHIKIFWIESDLSADFYEFYNPPNLLHLGHNGQHLVRNATNVLSPNHRFYKQPFLGTPECFCLPYSSGNLATENLTPPSQPSWIIYSISFLLSWQTVCSEWSQSGGRHAGGLGFSWDSSLWYVQQLAFIGLGLSATRPWSV